jgi:hypothetical protein
MGSPQDPKGAFMVAWPYWELAKEVHGRAACLKFTVFIIPPRARADGVATGGEGRFHGGLPILGGR